jgi:hypothetical protein
LLLGSELGAVLGETVGEELGSFDGAELGPELGERLGLELGIVLGVSVGRVDGLLLGLEFGAYDGVVLGCVVGSVLGNADGTSLGRVLGTPLGTSLTVLLGTLDGDLLTLGALLGDSVGHTLTNEFGDGVFESSLQIPMCAMADGPYNWTLTFDTDATSITTFLYDFAPMALTTNVCMASSESVTWIQTSSTTLTSPISTNSSTGVANSKVIMPPISFAFGVGFAPVCWTINTFPKSPARSAVP